MMDAKRDSMDRESFRDKILNGDALAISEQLPDEVVQTIVTSPPYYRHRKYGSAEQLGQETTPDEYVANLVAAITAAKNCLANDGTLWLNLGDTSLKGELLGLPWRVALALRQRGWLLISDIIWHKPNAMPSSSPRRPTTDHEYIFLFAKGPGYYYDADAIREPHKTFTPESKMMGGRRHLKPGGATPEAGKFAGQPGLHQGLHNGKWDKAFHPLGRNRRTVWSVPLGKFRGTHFAVFPPDLIRPCILATSRPGDLVMDPFLGSGTTAVVAKSLGRSYLRN